METQPTEKKEKKSGKAFLIFLVFLEFIACGILVWLLLKERENVKIQTTEKIVYIDKSNKFQQELAELRTEYQDLETEDAELNKQLQENIAKIQDLEIQAEKHKDDAYVLSKLKKEAETLRAIMKSFVRTIDSLNTLNQTITAEKAKVMQDLGSEKTRTETLKKEKEDLQNVIYVGSLLRAFNINAKAMRFKSDGTREIETNKAKKTEKLKVEFTLAENRLTKKGDRVIYARVMSPDGKEMAKAYNESNMFKFKGLSGFFSGQQSLNYQNKEMMMGLYCERKGEFVPGKYLIELYSDGGLIGETSLTLE